MRELRKVTVSPGSEIDRLLDEVDDEPILLEKAGALFRLSAEREDIWAGYDPEKVRQAIDEAAGAWADLDADALIAEVYHRREQGSRPPTRP
ncbi:MAG: hypothetical protein M1358_22350 [Chloroflexi bacterium]|nr:hypothetical protein [Chloroflexota bacterium]